MNEKIKKKLMVMAYQAAFAAAIFAALFLIDRFAPRLTEKISVIWTKNTDLKKAAELAGKAVKELLPF